MEDCYFYLQVKSATLLKVTLLHGYFSLVESAQMVTNLATHHYVKDERNNLYFIA